MKYLGTIRIWTDREGDIGDDVYEMGFNVSEDNIDACIYAVERVVDCPDVHFNKT